MIDLIKIVNQTNKEEITIDRVGDGSYVLETIDFDKPTVEKETYKVPQQIGENFKGNIIGTRSISITGYVISDKIEKYLGTKWSDYLMFQKEDIFKAKNVLNKFLNINDLFRIYVGDLYIECRLSEPIKYSADETNNNEILCLFEMVFDCYNPMFQSETKEYSAVSDVEGFEFPFEFTNETIFGTSYNIELFETENNGDIDSGFELDITANGRPINDIVIGNIEQGEVLELDNIYVKDGETIRINTNEGQEKIEIYKGELESGISLVGNISMLKKLPKILKGTNTFIVRKKDGTTDAININLKYKEQHFNFKEQ